MKDLNNKETPNIIFIVIDALRPKNLSMYDYKKETDKNLKKIAKENLFFKDFYSASNSTAPSLNSIFTGLYPPNHGILHQFPYTSDEEIDNMDKQVKFWLPSYLKEKGYETMAVDWIGLWFKKGFDYYEEKETKKGKSFLNTPIIKKILLNLPAWAYKLGKKMIKTRSSEQFSPAIDTANLGISKIKEAKKPFFLFMHFWDTHFPYPTTKYKAREDESDIEETLKKIKENNQKEYFKKRAADINLNSTKDMENKYDTAIKNIDSAVGKIYSFLKNEKMLDNTIIVIQGDHGDSVNEHGIFFEHSGLYDVSIHVPLIVHIPGVQPKEVRGLAENVDVIPTILEFLKDNPGVDFDGRSLWPLINGGEKVRDKILSWDGLSHEIRSIRTENRKLIIAKDPTCHLCKSRHHQDKEEYDLENDKDELNNVYSGESDLEKNDVTFIKNKDNSI